LIWDVDYLLMVDSDMGPDYLLGDDPTATPFWKTAWEFMMERREQEQALDDEMFGKTYQGKTPDCQVHADWMKRELFENYPPATIAAPYCGPPPDEGCYVFQWHSMETATPNPSFRLQMINREDAAIRSGIEEAAALPTGLILYDARVFKVLEENNGLPWFDYEYEDKYEMAKATTEDVYQTRNASMLGMPQYVAWNCWAKHHKWKGVEKPHVITKDSIHKSLVHSIEKGFKHGQKVHFQRRARILPVEDARKAEKAAGRPENGSYGGMELVKLIERQNRQVEEANIQNRTCLGPYPE
jgi:hypothetical protein